MNFSTMFRGAAIAALAGTAGACIVEKAAADPTWAWAGAVRATEEDRQFKVNGRIMYDVYHVQANFPGYNSDLNYTQSDLRRLFLGVEGRYTQNWRYNIKLAFNPTSSTSNGAVTVDDAFLEYNGGDWSIWIGQNNVTSPMEDRDSSLNIPFNERSAFINAFGFAKKMGIAATYNGGNYSLAAGIYGKELSTTDATNGNEETSELVRATWAPYYERTPNGIKLLHVGATFRHRDNGGADTPCLNVAAKTTCAQNGFQYRARPTVGFGARLVDTGAVFDRDNFIGVETAGQWNQFGFDGEYGKLEATPIATIGTNRANRQYEGGYVSFYWSPTGESRNYSAGEGTFGRVAPFRTLGSDGGIGHVMLSARYDYLDLSDELRTASVQRGGKQQSVIGQATWMPIQYVKFQLSYAKNYITNYTTTAGGSVAAAGAFAQRGTADSLVFRTQLDW